MCYLDYQKGNSKSIDLRQRDSFYKTIENKSKTINPTVAPPIFYFGLKNDKILKT